MDRPTSIVSNTSHSCSRYLGFYDRVEAFGIVDRDPYDASSAAFADRNLALPMGLPMGFN
jgi:hypothetical protein